MKDVEVHAPKQQKKKKKKKTRPQPGIFLVQRAPGVYQNIISQKKPVSPFQKQDSEVHSETSSIRSNSRVQNSPALSEVSSRTSHNSTSQTLSDSGNSKHLEEQSKISKSSSSSSDSD